MITNNMVAIKMSQTVAMANRSGSVNTESHQKRQKCVIEMGTTEIEFSSNQTER